MRLWSLHPKYLDAKGLVALWREGLLAQKVLLGLTRGYTRHPQLQRFRETADPVTAIGTYLRQVVLEARRRGYAFDESKIVRDAVHDVTRNVTPDGAHACVAATEPVPFMTVSDGQLDCEWRHLLRKLAQRCPAMHEALRDQVQPDAHPIFIVVAGPAAHWERAEQGDAG